MLGNNEANGNELEIHVREDFWMPNVIPNHATKMQKSTTYYTTAAMLLLSAASCVQYLCMIPGGTE